jgi:fused signal recognition particle receptor
MRAGKLWSRLSKTRTRLTDRINAMLKGKREIDPTFLEELEEILLTSDIGVDITGQLIERLRQDIDREHLKNLEQLKAVLKQEMISFLESDQGLSVVNKPSDSAPGSLEVIMFAGINGVGKTTTIAKMAKYVQHQGNKVMLVAADTFRAAAVEQLQIWGDRLGAEVIGQKRGADPAAVVFDALTAAQARKADKVFIDTAGRLHTKSNLMDELIKVQRVAGQKVPGAPHRVILVLDATTGQNAIVQSQAFAQSLQVTDIILTKLDGTAKGGAILDISRKLHIPISFICTGEGLDDFDIFNPKEFVEAIFA